MEPEFMSDALDDLAAEEDNERALLALIDRVTDHMDDRSIVERIRYGSFADGMREFARYKLARYSPENQARENLERSLKATARPPR